MPLLIFFLYFFGNNLKIVGIPNVFSSIEL
jgi:hypothetical protein